MCDRNLNGPFQILGGIGEQREGPIEDLAEQLSSGIKEHQIRLIAVLPLNDASHEGHRHLGHYLTGKLTNARYNTGSANLWPASSYRLDPWGAWAHS